MLRSIIVSVAMSAVVDDAHGAKRLIWEQKPVELCGQ